MQDETEWLRDLVDSREVARDYYLSAFNWRGSPVPEGFDGPRYYPPDITWRIEARLDSNTPGAGMQVELATSIGDLRPFIISGTFLFTIGGREWRLLAYSAVPSDPEYDYLFVPFRDGTSGSETYGGGRYLDAARSDGDLYLLDFNSAYNPSCAYSPRYNCPYPPLENNIELRIEAGEKAPVHGK